jgi:hypothetical protein
MTTFAPQVGCAVVFLCATLWASNAHGYPQYDDGAGNGCVECHTGFQGGPSGALHFQHVNHFDPQSCNLCHPSGSGTKPVLTYWSGPGGGFGCAGCHGQDYGETSPNSGQPKATAYGLRKFHVEQQGITACGAAGGCHVAGSLGHPNPLPTLFPESEPPPYYAPAFSNLTDPCASYQEDLPFDGDSVGLDNDGDGVADYPADSDCALPETPTFTPTATPTPTPAPFDCASGPVEGCIAPGKAVLLVSDKADKEKMKLLLKKLQPAVDPGQFGNPSTGTTAYKVCIYDGADQLSGEYVVAKAGAVCGDVSCWSTKPDKGYKYRDKSLSADGILKINLFGGDPGKGKVLFLGKQAPQGIAAALQDQTSATVQVLTSDASCFGASLPIVKKADGTIFKALGP